MGLFNWLQSQPTRSSPTTTTPSTSTTDTRILDDTPPQDLPIDSTTTPSEPAAPPPLINRSTRILTAGILFSALSIFVTRRSLRRRAVLRSFDPSSLTTHGPDAPSRPNAALDALEAFNLATINVVSAAMVLGGGTMYYLNINSMEDARRFVRGSGDVGTWEGDEKANEEIEEVLASILVRKEVKDRIKAQVGGGKILEEVERVRREKAEREERERSEK